MKKFICILMCLAAMTATLQAQTDILDTSASSRAGESALDNVEVVAASCDMESSAIDEAKEVTELYGDTTGIFYPIVKAYSENMNYWFVGGLMAVESSFIPFPSEVIIPPAVFVATPDKEGNSPSDMKVWLIVLFGTLGALFGAFVNYYLSRWLGRPIIYSFVDSKVGHLLGLSGEKMERAEKYFNDHGNMSTLVGRLIPVIRQLISIPAGLAKMNVGAFAFYTTLGALIWNVILAALGYAAAKAGGMEFISKYSHELSIAIIALVGLVVVYFVAKKFFFGRKKETK